MLCFHAHSKVTATCVSVMLLLLGIMYCISWCNSHMLIFLHEIMERINPGIFYAYHSYVWMFNRASCHHSFKGIATGMSEWPSSAIAKTLYFMQCSQNHSLSLLHVTWCVAGLRSTSENWPQVKISHLLLLPSLTVCVKTLHLGLVNLLKHSDNYMNHLL